jgi:hypothetical protein
MTVALGLALALLIGASSSTLETAAICAFGIAAVLATRFPEAVAASALALGALLPSFLVLSPAWFPVTVTGSLMVAALLAVCALCELLQEDRMPLDPVR